MTSAALLLRALKLLSLCVSVTLHSVLRHYAHNTRFYPFFEGASGVDIIPKLIEIGMRSGTFEVGETVRGFNGDTLVFSARVAAPNHKSGPFNSPARTYIQTHMREELSLLHTLRLPTF